MAVRAVSTVTDGAVKSEPIEPVVKKPRTSRAAAKSAAMKLLEEEEEAEEEVEEKPSKGKAKKARTIDDDAAESKPPAKKARGKAKAKAVDGDSEAKPAPKARGKASIWPPPDLDPASHPPRAGFPIFDLPPLTVPRNGGLPSSQAGPRPHYLGAHTSIAGGPATALFRAGKAGANGLALFVKSQRQWKSNPYEQESIDRFRAGMKPIEEGGMGYGPETILVHGSYLINLGNPDPIKWNTSYACFKDDIERCHQLGVKLYNWHPGSTVGACTKEESFSLIAKAINRVHREVPEVIAVIENMANAKSNLVGTDFKDLKAIIDQVDDKSRVRVCLDTCHMFAAGYDIRTPEAYRETLAKFNEEVGNEYLGGMHLNDSKTELGSCKDLHENIGLGHIGLTAFREIMRDPLMSGIPLVLETPAGSGNPLEVGELSIWNREITLLYKIQGMDDETWAAEKENLEKEWRAERDAINPPKPAKEKKGKVAANGTNGKGKGKGKKGKKVEEEECESHAEDSE